MPQDAFDFGRGKNIDAHFGQPHNNRYEGDRDHIRGGRPQDRLGPGALPQHGHPFAQRPGGYRPVDNNIFGIAAYDVHGRQPAPQRIIPNNVQQLPADPEPGYPSQDYQPLPSLQPVEQPYPPPPPQYQPQADPRTQVAAQRQKRPDVAGKIGGEEHVLPARRRAEFLEQQMREQAAAAEVAAALAREQGFGPSGEPIAPLRDPEEQREYDATVNAIHREIQSTYIHQQVLEKRRSTLENRLAAMEAGGAFP